MAEQHYFLISSLPLLSPWEQAPVTTESFLAACASWLTEAELQTLRSLGLEPDSALAAVNPVVERWIAWETCLRNRLAKARAIALGLDPERCHRHDLDFFSAVDRAVQDARAASDPLAGERVLDKARWVALDDLEAGHSFDFAKLCVYKLKLALREKIARRDRKRGVENLEEALRGLYNPEAHKIEV